MADTDCLYERVGGRVFCFKLATAFYARVAKDAVLRPLFPGKSFRCATEAFSAFLVQFLGGPGEEAEDRWWLSLHESHMRFRIGLKERQAWMSNMAEALDDAGVEEPMRGQFLALFERSSAYLTNQGAQPAVENGQTHAELSLRWEAQLELDKAVTAIQRGDVRSAIDLAGSPALRSCSSAARCGLLALMIRSGDAALVAYAGEQVSAEPGLALERIRHGRTLLHEAAAAGNRATAELLLRLGADATARDANGHTALYALSNECAEGGADVVGVLIRAGADVNASDGVKRCTPLHMAARRGNVEIAEALLECGANIEARERGGDTPLRRAMNCRKARVAGILAARGAENVSPPR